jgi:hypothetical protein
LHLDFDDLILGQLGPAIFLTATISAVLESVSLIFRFGRPAEIFEPIVSWVAVVVRNLMIGRRAVAVKRATHEAMNRNVGAFSIAIKRETKMPILSRIRF